MEVRKAKLQDLKKVASLFDAYRQFYGRPADLEGAESFLEERMLNRESVIFIAFIKGEAAGFTQLYPVFSSVSMQRLWLLNDLYVAALFRKQGVGETLIDAAKNHARETNAKGLTLETQVENESAQRLYDKAGFSRDTDFYHYFWKA